VLQSNEFAEGRRGEEREEEEWEANASMNEVTGKEEGRGGKIGEKDT
jgi:hypothetical protein